MEEEGLVFENDAGNLTVVPTDALASLFELFSDGVKCVVLNACFSVVQAKAIASHVQHVVGMQLEIDDRAAIEFTVGFYDALGAGKPVPIAYRFGCNAVRLVGLDEHSTPVLLTRQGLQSPHSITHNEMVPHRASGAVVRRGEIPPSSDALTVGTIDDVQRWGWNGIRLLEELIRLDYETTDGLISTHEGDPEQWGPVFMTHPDTWRLLTVGPESIVGYWHWAPLFSSEYALAKSGALLDSMITVNTVQFFELPGIYDLYFVQICMLPEYRRPHALQRLFDTVFELLEALSQNSIYAREITANAYTRAGEALCRSLGMRHVCSHQERGEIYSALIGEILHHPVAQRRVGLLRQYSSQGLV